MQHCLKNILLIACSMLDMNDMLTNGILKQLYGCLTAFALIFSGERCNAQETNTTSTNLPPEFVFPVGEKLIYKIYWGYIPVGTTTITTEWLEENGRKLLAIRYKTHTNRIFDTIYPIDDTAESIVNPDNFLPLRFAFCLTRRSSKNEGTATFDHGSLKATLVTKNASKTNEIAIAQDTRDIISLLYNHRSSELLPRQEMKHRFMADAGLLDMRICTYDYEKVDLDAFGKVSSLRLEPIAKLDNLLVENGKVMSWVAKERCLATKMTIKAPLANVSIELTEVLGPGNDFWSKAMQKKAAK